MNGLGWINATWCVVLGGVLLYLLGVHIGKRYERRVVTAEFQQIVIRMLHLAAKQDYTSLHAMLQDLCADPEVLEELRKKQQHTGPESVYEQFEQIIRDRLDKRPTVGNAPTEEKEPTR